MISSVSLCLCGRIVFLVLGLLGEGGVLCHNDTIRGARRRSGGLFLCDNGGFGKRVLNSLIKVIFLTFSE